MKIGFHTDAFNRACFSFEKYLTRLRDHACQGVLSMECEGQAGPMIEKSLAWLRQTLADLKIHVET
jgi:sugar phosphate isomerase/epimerase